MRRDAPTEPWLSFLNEIERDLDSRTDLHCIGGFAVVQAYGLERATADLDVISIVPHETGRHLAEIAGKESMLRQKYGIYLDTVGVASVPEDYPDRMIPLYANCWQKLRLFALEAHDLALTKLERNFERDRADVAHLARSGFLNAETLRARYFDEMRPYVIGRTEWHDQTLQMWIDSCWPSS